MRPNFDPDLMVPQDDEEAMEALKREDGFLTEVLQNLYRVLRAQGDEVLVAYEATLRAHVDAFNHRQEIATVEAKSAIVD